MAPGRKIVHSIRSLLKSEAGTVYKEHGGRCRVCLIYPNTYHVGMSNLGFRLLYGLLNARADVVCERAFLPGQALLPEYEKRAAGLVSMESMSLLSAFDILAFSLSFENDYPHVAKILQMSAIPLYARQRSERHPLLLAGGPCAFMNPEPVADFFDIICVGEAEAFIDGFFDAYRDSRTRDGLYSLICGREGVYLPAACHVEYHEDGPIKERVCHGTAPPLVKRCMAADLDSLAILPQPVARETEFSGMYLVEAMRGCPWKCRFCAVSGIYSPARKRSFEVLEKEIKEAAHRGLRVGLLGPSLSDYPRITDLLCMEGVDFSITSLRASKKSAHILSLMKHKTSVSIAPEAGSQRLRQVINKKVEEEDIIETAGLIMKQGMGTLRLYFMVGLPSETDRDMEETIALARRIKALSTRTEVVLSVSTFVPKPFTPFQWHPMEEPEAVKRRLRILKEGLKKDRVKVFHDMPKYAYGQGLFSLGDRRVAQAIEVMNTTGDWRNACERTEVDAGFYIFREKQPDEILPWDFIGNGIDKGRLRDEYMKALLP